MINLIQGDCLEVMKDIPDGSVDMVMTSPPYDDLRSYSSDMSTNLLCISESYRLLGDGGVCVWVVGDATKNGSESGSSFRQAIHAIDIGFNLHDTMIFKKKNYVPLTHNRYEQCFDYMFVFSKGKPSLFNPIMIDCKNKGKVERYGSGRRSELDKKQSMRSNGTERYIATKQQKIAPNIFEYSIGHSGYKHPAVYPLPLPTDQINTWTREGLVVLDPFMGSGTTGVACKQTGRDFIGIEMDEGYFQIAKDRIEGVLI